MKKKSLKINDNLHKKIKLYCVENNLNIYNFVEETLLKKINKINDNNKNIKNNNNK